MLMCTQFSQFILKISSGNEILTLIKGHNSKFYHSVLAILVVTESNNHITTERHGDSSIAPLFHNNNDYNNDKVHYTAVVLSSLQVFALLSVKKLTNILIPPRESTVSFFFILYTPYTCICAKYYVQDSKALSKKKKKKK